MTYLLNGNIWADRCISLRKVSKKLRGFPLPLQLNRAFPRIHDHLFAGCGGQLILKNILCCKKLLGTREWKINWWPSATNYNLDTEGNPIKIESKRTRFKPTSERSCWQNYEFSTLGKSQNGFWWSPSL